MVEVDKTECEDDETCDGCGDEDNNEELVIKLPQRHTFLKMILCASCREAVVDGIEDD